MIYEMRVGVIGKATSLPVIEVDGVDGHVRTYTARWETPNNVVFDLSFDPPGAWGAHLKWKNHEFDWQLPDAQTRGGQYQIPTTIVFDLDVPQLHVEGQHFYDQDGTRRSLLLHSDFRLFKMALDGEDFVSVLKGRAPTIDLPAHLVTGPRVFLSCRFLFDLDPLGKYAGSRFYDALVQFSRTLADLGQCWEATVFADAQGLQVNAQQILWESICSALSGEPNVIIELGNENMKNGVDAKNFSNPHNGVAVSSGSYCDGWVPTGSWGNYVTFHPQRTWKWACTVAQTVNELYRGYPGQDKAILINEPIGAAEQEQDGRRANNPVLFERMAVDCAVWAAGLVFHSEAGLGSNPWGDIQQQCWDAVCRGVSVGSASR